MRFFEILFRNGDYVCAGSRKVSLPVPARSITAEGQEFFCINPIHPHKDFGFQRKSHYRENKPRRADINVVAYKNFMFEMDSVPIEDQMRILHKCEIPWTSLIHSGAKSLHAILSLITPLNVPMHTKHGIEAYKHTWRRLAALIDLNGLSLYNMPKNKNSFVDRTSINPSRLSRFPDSLRDNGHKQKSIRLDTEIGHQDFMMLLSRCPKIEHMQVQVASRSTKSTESVQDFIQACPKGLWSMLMYAGEWAAPEGLYMTLLRLTLWSIDATNCTQDVLLEFMEKNTFPKLDRAGYPREKMYKAIGHAYEMKE